MIPVYPEWHVSHKREGHDAVTRLNGVKYGLYYWVPSETWTMISFSSETSAYHLVEEGITLEDYEFITKNLPEYLMEVLL